MHACIRKLLRDSMHVCIVPLMPVDAETAFLADRATAHAAARGVDIATHRAGCDCGNRPTFCSWCDFDFEGSDALTFENGLWLCDRCSGEGVDTDNDQPALAAE